jgi:hypothetical protein
MAASEIRRAIVGNIPECLRNCVNKEYFRTGSGFSEGEKASKFDKKKRRVSIVKDIKAH